MPAWLRWLLRLSLLVDAVLSVALTVETIRGAEGWPRRAALSAEVDNVARDIAGLETQVRTIQREIVAERERPEVQEALVRDLLGYVRPQDVVLRGLPTP